MKSIAEIADEYAANVEIWKRHREELRRRLQAETQCEVALRLRQSINATSKAIGDSQNAIAIMRGNKHGI